MAMKGNIQDFLLIPAVLFAIALVGPAIWGTASSYLDQLGVNFNVLGFETSRDIINVTSTLSVTYDQVFLIMAVGMGLATIISSFFIDSHPLFFFVSLIVFLIAMTVAPILSNAYNGYIQGFQGIDALQSFPITSFIVQNYGVYLLGIFALTGVALYAKFVRGRE